MHRFRQRPVGEGDSPLTFVPAAVRGNSKAFRSSSQPACAGAFRYPVTALLTNGRRVGHISLGLYRDSASFLRHFKLVGTQQQGILLLLRHHESLDHGASLQRNRDTAVIIILVFLQTDRNGMCAGCPAGGRHRAPAYPVDRSDRHNPIFMGSKRKRLAPGLFCKVQVRLIKIFNGRLRGIRFLIILLTASRHSQPYG